ncbi:hypothetical protein DL769_007580 [Monosporascus sp. CRB-8-3]|nr:hypothetical protein DL769_007580 [Monosporascus sp. CRB-8-3]
MAMSQAFPSHEVPTSGEISLQVLGYLGYTLGALKAVRERIPQSYVVLNFRKVQQKRIDGLQREIVDKLALIEEATKKPPTSVTNGGSGIENMNHELDQLLHVYANALRDYETFSQEPIANPKEEKRMRGLLPDEPPVDCDFRELNREIRLEKERREAFGNRLIMGMSGGLALIIPMLIMALFPGLKTSLITSSVATMAFASWTAHSADNAAGKDVLAAVAAYAAVLVVFVGASMAPVN